MPNWDQGYYSEVPYEKYAFSFLSPAHLNAALALGGHAVKNLGKPFTYCELGSGFGLTIAGAAAQYPGGEFYSVDFNPAQTAWQLRLKEAAGLSNLHVYERSFGQALDEDLPKMDFIVVHGIYSWVVPEVRRDIVAFVAKFLKTSGVVYLSYNCQPRWGMAEPLRRVIMEGAKATGEKDLKAISQGLGFLKELREAGALYFKAGERPSGYLDEWLEKLGSSPHYLVGELFSVEHKAFFFNEVAADMAGAQAAYAGSTDISEYLEGVITPKPFLQRLNQVSGDAVLRGMVKDLLYDKAFRKDLYVRGGSALSPEEAAKAFDKVGVVLSVEKPLGLKPVNVGGVEVTLKSEIYEPVIDFLARGPSTVGNLAEGTGLPADYVRQAVAVLLAIDWAQACPPVAQAERVKRFNAALNEVLGGEPRLFFLVPEGSWLQWGNVETMYALALSQGVEPVPFILGLIAENGWTLNREGRPVPEAELPAFLAGQVKAMDAKLRPILVRLGCTE